MSQAAIWKFPLEGPVTVLKVPERRKFLSCAMEGDTIVLWFLVDSEMAKVDVLVQSVNTGGGLPDHLFGRQFLGTVSSAGEWGRVVWHLFSPNADGLHDF